MQEILDRSWDLYCRSWVALCASVGDLGRSWVPVGGLGPLLGLCGRSWAALGAYLGGLGLLLGPLRAVLSSLLGPILAVLGLSWAMSAPS